MIVSTLRRKPDLAWALVLGSLAVVGFIDHVTGLEIGVSIFYLLPIMVAANTMGRRQTYMTAVLAAVLCHWIDAVLGARHYSVPHFAYWNGGVRLGFFMIVAHLKLRARRAIELERQINSLKTEMLAAVAHEFGNSLGALNLAVGMLEEMDVSPDQSRKKLYGMAHRVLGQLTAVARNFLNSARLESGHFELNLRSVSLRELVEQVSAPLELVAEEKGVAFVVEADPDLPLARADGDALGVVLTNILGNAVKYTPAGGRVTVSLSKAGRGLVEVAVADTGIGIAPEQRAAVFAGRRTEEGARMASGFGVGLKLSKDLLAAHGAKLQLESSPKRGSRFSFTLVAVPAPRASLVAA